MEYVRNCRVLTHALLAPRGCIPVELQGRARFAKWHLGIMKVVRSHVGCKLVYQYMQYQEEDYDMRLYMAECI